MKKKNTDLWLINRRDSGNVKVTTRCVLVPPSPTHSNDDEENSSLNKNISTSTSYNIERYAKLHNVSISPSTKSYNYSRNRSTTRSWPAIHNSFSTPHVTTKTEQQPSKNENRKSSAAYDFDQIFGLNNANYQKFLASHRKSSIFEIGSADKSPSIYDLQQCDQDQQHKQDSSNRDSLCFSAQPVTVFLLLTLLVTAIGTTILCGAIMSGEAHNLFIQRIFTWKTLSTFDIYLCNYSQSIQNRPLGKRGMGQRSS